MSKLRIVRPNITKKVRRINTEVPVSTYAALTKLTIETGYTYKELFIILLDFALENYELVDDTEDKGKKNSEQ